MSTPVITVRVVTSEADRAAVFALRERVFVQEQGVPMDIEMDELDADADHFIARLDGRVVGTGRLVAEDGGMGVLGRLAVTPAARGAGLGVALVAAIERRAAERGLKTIDLHAQVHARGFYERLGYTAEGDVFDEAGIAHITMRKAI